jgi:hypothetical protein
MSIMCVCVCVSSYCLISQDDAINTTFLFYGPAGLVQSDVRSYPASCVTDTDAVPVVTAIPELSLVPAATPSAEITTLQQQGQPVVQVEFKANFSAAELAAFPGIAALSGTVYGVVGGALSPFMTVAPAATANGVVVLGDYKQRAAPADATMATVAGPALIAKARGGGGFNVYSAANALPRVLFAALARSAGAHIYAENGSECGVQASGNALFIQAIGPNDAGTRSGVRHVLLPQPLLVTNAESGAKVCATACTSFEVDLDAGHSGLFIVEAAAVAESA